MNKESQTEIPEPFATDIASTKIKSFRATVSVSFFLLSNFLDQQKQAKFESDVKNTITAS